ncbi:SDR family NAD(P)-dependent oxidoreductase [Streptomyces sp. NPDC051546]|uniref:SDR family NAD(P)-dependent oxidoreductase n=1 Tax=Streptomyces sp. NPDC051546 TaxID=3365655 RepID=UPI0037A321D0
MANGEPGARSDQAASGRTALVTGGNGELGYQAALRLAADGRRVLLGSRDAGRGNVAAAAIRVLVPVSSVAVIGVDLADLESVRAAAAGLVRDEESLDLLLNNAGVMAVRSLRLTAQDLELQIGTNRFGQFALTGLVLPLLLRRPGSRVVTITSVVHRWRRPDFANLRGERRYAPWKAYRASKLANAVFAVELDRRLKALGGSVLRLSAHPGVTATGLGSAGPSLGGGSLLAASTAWGLRLVGQKPLGRLRAAPEGGARPSGGRGELLRPQGVAELRGAPGPVPFGRSVHDPSLARRLWSESERLTGVSYSR